MKLILLFIFLFSSFSIANDNFFQRDPFVPILYSGSSDITTLQSQEQLLVKVVGIIWSEENPAAALEVSSIPKIVYEDEEFLGIKVLVISKKDITLSYKSAIFVLNLNQEILLK